MVVSRARELYHLAQEVPVEVEVFSIHGQGARRASSRRNLASSADRFRSGIAARKAFICANVRIANERACACSAHETKTC
jgi:hypothetical protein